ncbi:MAG: hypothetical protein KDK53_16775 [Maritimibacter sp.]|nr:hypothetical protein [Maritimibacter sp.]
MKRAARGTDPGRRHVEALKATDYSDVGLFRAALAHDTALPADDLPEALPPRAAHPGRPCALRDPRRPDPFALCWTLPKRQAILCAVEIGRSGLQEEGTVYVGAEREWPSWTPTPEMTGHGADP